MMVIMIINESDNLNFHEHYKMIESFNGKKYYFIITDHYKNIFERRLDRWR